MFKESREYKGRSDKARELYDIAWKYLRPLWHFKIAALYAPGLSKHLRQDGR